MPIELVVWDFDGVIADTTTIAYQVMSKIFEEYGVKPPEREIFLRDITSNFVGFYHHHGIPPSVGRDSLNRLWELHFAAHVERGLPLREGLLDLLTHCTRARISTAIVSGNAKTVIHNTLIKYGIDHLFGHIRSDACGKAGELTEVLTLFECPPERAVYIDDTREGVAASRAVGMIAVGITGGFNSSDQIQQANPHHLIDHLAMVMDVLKVSA